MKFEKKYSNEHIHFIDLFVPKTLESFIKNLPKDFKIVDLGCGDGRLLYALTKKGLLKNADEVVGIDLAENRIERVREILPSVKGIVADACNVKELPDDYFDMVICQQVTEHVPDDKVLLEEIKRLSTPNGITYISSVIKKSYTLYVYRDNKGFKLDPTHVREYTSKEEFLNLLRAQKFEPILTEVNAVSFPVIDLLVRGLIQVGIVEPNPKFYLSHPLLAKLRRILKLKIIGYQTISVLAHVTENEK